MLFLLHYDHEAQIAFLSLKFDLPDRLESDELVIKINGPKMDASKDQLTIGTVWPIHTIEHMKAVLLLQTATIWLFDYVIGRHAHKEFVCVSILRL